MNNKNKIGNHLSTFFTRLLTIPTWLLLLLIVASVSAAALNITAPSLTLAIISILLIAVGLIQKPAGSSVKTRIILFPDNTPNIKLTISKCPENVTPILLKLQKSKDELLKESIDDVQIGKVLDVIGDLAFEKTIEKDRKLENVENVGNHDIYEHHFPSEVELTFNYSVKVEEDFADWQSTNVKKGIIQSIDEAKLLPVYLYESPLGAEKPDIRIWKPFQNYSVDRNNRTITVKFDSWGDTNFGIGTKP